ncbi:MAG: PD40 domain-containing protein [Flavobacteriales bacterium]|nr:PD40 domain-containing protein [Flavobacteriales bacterium]
MTRVPFIALPLALSQLCTAQSIVEIEPLELGTLTEDYAPVLLDSGLVMCSIRETNATIAFKDAETGKPLTDLYWVPLKNGQTGTAVLFSQNLTTPVNEGPAAFSKDGRTIYFTRNQVLPKKLANLRASNGQLGLFVSRLENGVWSQPLPFAHNSPKYSIMHPALSADGSTLIFASDMDGGQGGVDLYRCERTSTGWSMPINLGANINGTGNDAFPSFGPDDALYFSSDRDGGAGALDIYRASPSASGWNDAEALPEPFNSTGRDMGITFSATGRQGYFSSDRTGTDRIFSFKHTVPKFRDCSPQQLNNYCYSFKAKPHAATSSLPLDHVWELGDGTRVTSLKVDHCYQRPGTFTVRSLLVDRKTGAIFHTLRSHDLVVEDVHQAWISAPDTVRTGRTMALDAKSSYLPEFAAAEFHWDMGDGTSFTGDKVLHAFKVPGEYEVKLDILAVPDANGVINNKCNSRKVIVIDRFRDHEDLTVVAVYQDALGKTHSFEFQELPFDQLAMSSDDMSDVAFAVELFASKDRVSLDDPKFTEIKKHYRVVERFDPERGVYTYSVGEAKNMEELYEVFKKVKELQFLDAEVLMLQIEKLMDLSKLDFASIQELNHAKLRTNAIHFAFKSADMGEGSEPVLEQILGLLRQHPEVQLVIEAHTDDIGSRDYNIDLSQQRAQSVQAYLLQNGIASERLIPVGHGKNQPIASNKTEEGRSQNRRVEFRMTVRGEQQAFEKTR